MRTRHILFLAFFLTLFSSHIRGQEMVLMNETISWDMNSAHGYYFFQPPAGSASNWSTPHDYYNGEFYARYEIISQPTNATCGLQFGIWQHRLESSIGDGEKSYSEVMSGINGVSGPGSVSTSHSSPTTWWYSYEGVDFSRVSDFWRLGINIWSLSPRSVIAPSAWGGDNELWAIRDQWFPIQVYVTVVAVAQGHTFSGWDNYTGGSTTPPTPDYSINYPGETTTQSVPSTDEYSLYSNMASAVSGSGSVVSLTPGQDMYFRTKAAGGNNASAIQQLSVPGRPGAPAFTYNEASQQTDQGISSEYEHSSNSNMSGAITGDGSQVSIPIGSTHYFRKKATSSAFKSNIQSLTGTGSGPAPNYETDFIEERTKTAVPAEDEYSYDNFATAGVSGSGTYLVLTPGQDVYFRTKAQGAVPASDIQHLSVPGRPGAPAFTYDEASQQTVQGITSEYEHSPNANMSGAIAGDGSQVSIPVGSTHYFRKKATSSAFKSNIQTLTATGSGPAPNYEIDFIDERTKTTVPSEDEYSYDNFATAGVSGTGDFLVLTPGQNIYFRTKAQGAVPASAIQHLSVPERPATPTFEIDFGNELSSTAVSSLVIYSINSNMSGFVYGTGVQLVLTPGTDLYFMVGANELSFRSDKQHLVVPQRPATPGIEIDFSNETSSGSVSDLIEYSSSSAFTVSELGNNEPISLMPGVDLYFRVKHSASSFRSLTQTLNIPARPILSGTNGADTITEEVFVVYALFEEEVTGFDLAKLEVSNGTLSNLRDAYVFDFNVTANNSIVSVMIPANIVNEGNFSSLAYAKYFNGIIQSNGHLESTLLSIYPNPFNDIISIRTSENFTGRVNITISDVSGRIVLNSEYESQDLIQLNLSDLNKGLYFLTLKTPAGSTTRSITKTQ